MTQRRQRVGPLGRSALVMGLLVTLGSTLAGAQGIEPEALSARFRQASRQALPGVVTVRALGAVSPLDEVMAARREPIGPESAARAVREGGSGFVVDAARGLVVTNDHVVAPATRGVAVILPNGRERPARQILRDPKSDLAVLVVDPSDLVALPWGEDRDLDIGDWVLAVGGPFGLSGSVTAGIISGKSRGIGIALYEDLIQTDAAINPGNSGGPLVNLRGEVAGVNTALKTTGGAYAGVGFAIPAGRARRVVADLIEFGRVRRAFIGINIRPADPAILTRLNVAEAVIVSSVVVGGPASQAGLQPGDVLLAVGGRSVGSAGALQARIEVAPVGEPVEVVVDRNGGPLTLLVRPAPQPDGFGLPEVPVGLAAPGEVIATPIRPPGLHINVPGVNLVVPGPNLQITPFGVTRLPAGGAVAPNGEAGPIVPNVIAEPELRPIAPVPGGGVLAEEVAARPVRYADLGVSLAATTPSLAARFGLDRGIVGLVVTEVEADGPADRGGLEPGMVITDVAGRLVGTGDEFTRALGDQPAGRDLILRIRRGAKAEFRVLVASRSPSPAAPVPERAADPVPDPAPPTRVPSGPVPRSL